MDKRSYTTIYVGCAGSGKTNTLIQVCKDYVARDLVLLHNVGFFTFSRAATFEAKSRICRAFPAAVTRQFPWFRTLHSFGMLVSNIPKETIVTSNYYKQFFEENGLTYDRDRALDFRFPVWDLANMATAFIYHDHIRRNRMLTVDRYVSGLPTVDAAADRLDYFTKAYCDFKQSRGLFDFTDLLELALQAPDLPTFEVLAIDEAQDLSLLQWSLVKRLMDNSNRVLVAGDDRQAIYTCFGADINTFIELPGHEIMLDQSYRCPKRVQEVAVELETRMTTTRGTPFKPIPQDGYVETVFNLGGVPIRINETWMFLSRTKYQREEMREEIGKRIEGIQDPDKLTQARNNIQFFTIHQAKGREADNVVVSLQISKRIMDSQAYIHQSFDDELRVFYVAFTRAKKRLYLYDTNKIRFPL